MNKTTTSALLVTALLAFLVAPAHAIITFTQLDQSTFTVSHRVKGIGSRGKATKLVYTKAASLCVAAGYSYYRVLGQESEASQQYQAANASVTVGFFFEDGPLRISCQDGSDPEYVQEAREKLQRQGYEAPEPTQVTNENAGTTAEDASEPSGSCPQGCTIEQIAAMARAGLPDEKILAACAAGTEQSPDGP